MAGKHSKKTSFDKVYIFFFLVGIRSVRCLKMLGRFTRLLWVPLVHALKRAGHWLFGRHFLALREEYRHLSARSRCRGVFRVVLNMALPVLATVVLLLTLQYWTGATFALALDYSGTSIGYIADEGVYADAAAIVRGSVINANESFKVEKAPQLQVKVLNAEAVLEETEVSNRILQAVGNELTSAAGLYVDGVFQGALPGKAVLQQEMDAVLATHKTDKVDGVGFVAQTQIIEGVYPVTALSALEDIRTYLETLTVKTMVNFTYTETVRYKTVYQQTDTLPLGMESVQRKGKNGKQKVYAQKIYVDGEKKYETVVSTEILQPTTDRVVLIGAQKYSEETELGDGVATGNFIWPLPYTKQISSYFASRWGTMHGAIDIANGSTNGKPIIASDGGTVMEADYHSSYGYYVLIDHGNGFKTRYAHCSKLDVKVGDKVAQGQYIAKVGNTGYSTGPHLHFEVIKNGVLVNPLNYVQR